MSNNEVIQENGMSRSKQKRAERIAAAKKMKRDRLKQSIIWTVVIVLVVVGLGIGIGTSVYKSASELNPNDQFSAKLADNGFIKGVKASKKVSLPDYKGITIPLSEVEFTQEEVDADIAAKLSANPVLDSTAGVEIADGDQVNIDYIGTLDGVAFEGGTASGYDLTIGSNMFIDGFETGLIGQKVGDTVELNLTFPEDYSTADLAGKDTVFTVVINGIYKEAVFDDAFVQANLSDYADTAEGYVQYLKENNYKKNMNEWITNYLLENTTLVSTPKSYVKHLEELAIYTDQQTYAYMNQMYASYYGYTPYSSFYEYVGSTEEEYMADLLETATKQTKLDLVYQAILEKEGITFDSQTAVNGIIAEEGMTQEYADSQLELYGTGFLAQTYVEYMAKKVIQDNAVIQ